MIAEVESGRMTNEEFVNWRKQNQENLSELAKRTFEGADSELTAEELAQHDPFIGEVLRVVPGSGSLSAEQLRGLAMNLDLTNTRHAGRQIRSLDDAMSYVGEQRGLTNDDADLVQIRDARRADPNEANPGEESRGRLDWAHVPDEKSAQLPSQHPTSKVPGKGGPGLPD